MSCVAQGIRTSFLSALRDAGGCALSRADRPSLLRATGCAGSYGEVSGSVAMLQDFIGKPIALQVEPGCTQEQYDVVLM